MELIAIALSAVAILVSLWGFIVDNRMNAANLQADYFKNIFEKYFMTEIPKKLECIYFESNGCLSEDYKQLTMSLMDMLGDSIYFKFANDTFYCKLNNKIADLDDKLIKYSKKTYKKSKQEELMSEIHNDIKKIIKLVNKYYKKGF